MASPPDPPATIWASATNATAFTASWSAVAGADSYRLDVATNDTFSGGAEGGPPHIAENIQNWTARTGYGGWTQSIPAGTVEMTQCIVTPNASASGEGSAGRVQLQGSTGILEWPALDTAGTVTVNLAAGGAGRTVKLQQFNGGAWDDLTTWTEIGTTGAAFTHDVNDSGPGVRLRMASPSAAIYVHDITVTSFGGSSEPAYVPGYSNRTVSGTSQSVTGLVENTTYYFRARAVNEDGSSANSPTGSVTTLSLVPPDAPALVWASATNETDFTAAWSAVAEATGYQLDVSESPDFLGDGIGQRFTNDFLNVSGGGSSSSYTTRQWTNNGDVVWTAYKARTDQTVNGHPAICLQNATDAFFISENIPNGIGSVSFDVEQKFSGSGGQLTVFVNGSSVGTFAYDTTVRTASFANINVAGVTTLMVSNNTAARPAIHNLVWTDYDPALPAFVPGYSNRAVSGTSQSVTGLVSASTYYFRVRAVSDGGVSANSAVANVTTVGDPLAPAFGANPGPLSATTGVERVFTVSASGYPAPVLALQSTTASGGHAFTPGTGQLSYTPPVADVGVRSFTFTASNSLGVATQTVVVSVSLPIPTVSFDVARLYGEEGGPDLTLPVHLSFAADATVQVAIAGTALPDGVDFSVSTTTLVFSAAGSTTANLVLSIVDDDLPEGPESCRLSLIPVAGAAAGAIPDCVLFIRDNDAFSVLTSNLTSGDFQQYLPPGERILQALCPDIVLMQEFNLPGIPIGSTNDYRAWVDEHFGSDFHFYVEPEWHPNPLPTGIISRWPILDAGEWADEQVPNRDFSWATIELPGPRQLHAVSVHLNAQYASVREAQARALTNYIAQAGWDEDDYLVLGGDMNLVGRGEAALLVLTNAVSDARQPADQNGGKNTNRGRTSPYDYVLPNAALDGRHRTVGLWGYEFPDGVVFDTRLAWADGVPPPALGIDSEAWNMQHMAVMKVFELESHLSPPQVLTATAAGPGEVTISWTANPEGDDVLIVWNETGTFQNPSGAAPDVGEPFAGGTVLYKGDVSPQSHAGLAGCATYFYQAWAHIGTNYSSGVPASATLPGPDAPAAVWVAVTNATGFVAAWSEVAGVSEYRLDVSESATFDDGAGEWGTVFRETMGTVSGTTAISTHEANNGFDNTAYVMSSGGAAAAADVRATAVSSGYTDAAGHAASGEANIWFAASGERGFGIAGIDSRGYAALRLGFGYRKESDTENMAFAVQWSTNGGGAWHSIAVSNLPAEGAAAGWTMVSNLAVAAAATGSTDLRLRWVKTAGSGRIDDVLLQGMTPPAEYVSGYSNRAVSGTSHAVTGLTAGVTTYFRVRAGTGECMGDFSPTGSVTTREEPTLMERFEEWLAGFGLTPGDPLTGPEDDWDGDGITNWQEFVANTDPTDGTHRLMMEATYTRAAVEGGPTGVLRFTFPASTSRYYQLVYSTNLLSPRLVQSLGWGTPGPDGTMTLTNDAPGAWYGTIRALLEAPD